MGKRVAIIGGGISGLAVAWNLRGAGCEIDLYEKAMNVGGNAYTSNVRFKLAAPHPFMQRFADLGVNDFNLRTYTNVVGVLDALNVKYLDLEDTASFFDVAGDVTYTLDGLYGTEMPAKIRDGFAFFREQAPKDYAAGTYAGATILQYLQTPQYNAYMPDLAEYCVLPRVNAMYFCDDAGAMGMPFTAIMHYYMLQEGMGTPQGPLRKYWVGGTNAQWIPRLRAQCGANVISSASVRLDYDGSMWTVSNGGSAQRYDVVVIACHAQDASGLFNSGLPPLAAQVLTQFRYCNSTAYCHQWPGVLPANRNAWRTYNVRIRTAGDTTYSMTYVENRHQKDEANPLYNQYGLPEFYTTLNPNVPIPNDLVFVDPSTAKPCVAPFPHNVVDFTAMNAQASIPSIQGVNAIYWTGGWTQGAGLHEECWESAMEVAKLIQGQQPDPHLRYDVKRGPGLWAPRYMRRALGIE
jgi:predicted NAD/FAD-binding protein